MEIWNLQQDSLSVFPELYLAPPSEMIKLIAAAPDEINSLALVAHNPGITEFINSLTNNRVDDLPTCGMVAFQIDTDSWSAFRDASKEWLFIEYPKRDPSLG